MRLAIGRPLPRHGIRPIRLRRRPVLVRRLPESPREPRVPALRTWAPVFPPRNRVVGSSAAPTTWFGNDPEAGFAAAVTDNDTSVFDFGTHPPGFASHPDATTSPGSRVGRDNYI